MRTIDAPRQLRRRTQRSTAAFAMMCLVGGLPARAQPGPSQPAPSSVSRGELVRRVQTLADALARRDEFAGVVSLSQGGTVVFEKAYGYADREAKRANAVTTSFNVASIGKLFTQVAIGQLVATGKLSLDSTIATYWPDYPNRDAARKVTLRQLLAHRSGIDGNIFENPLTLRTNRDNLAAVTRTPLAFEPGTAQRYSNAGYVVLGEIVERVSGEPYHEYIQRRVFDTAGMRASGFFAVDSLPATAARGYTRGMEPTAAPSATLPPLTRNEVMQPRRGSAAGGSYASVQDLLRFVRARRDGSLGVALRSAREIAAGGSPGTNGIIAEGLPGDYDLIVLANMDPPAASNIADSVEAWLGGGNQRGGAGPVRVGGPPGEMRAPGQVNPIPPLPDGPMASHFPDSPHGQTAAAYLRAFSSGNADEMRAFITARVMPNGRSIDDRLQQYRMMFADMGPLTLRGVRTAPDGSLVIEVRSATVGDIAVMMSFAPGAADRVAGIQFRVER
jgi:D-alanyl-D-alanine carboxypeptidase